MRSRLAGSLFKLARLPFFSRLAVWMITHMSFAVPITRLRETPTLLAFHHPQPSHRVHILILPKQPAASLLELSAQDTAFLSDLIAAVQSLVAEFNLQGGYRLIANGGEYQEFPHLHFHLVGDTKGD